LTKGELLRGAWFERTKEFADRQRGETVFPLQFATTFDVSAGGSGIPRAPYSSPRSASRAVPHRSTDYRSSFASRRS
jgi:hypothetical protein